MIYGQGNYKYECVQGWGLEAKQRWNDIKEVAGITVDRDDNIYILTRTNPPVIVLNKAGKVIDSFGEGIFVRPHGMYRNNRGIIYGVDDNGHCAYEFDAEKRLTRTIGQRGVPSDTGCINKDYKTIVQAAGPFNYPTRLVTDDDGNIYITDGYGNARVHKFTSEGVLIKSWGTPGNGPGEFNLPHGIAIDREKILYVADRQNHRVQLFNTDGDFIASWDNFHRPSDVWIDKDEIIYVAECKRSSVWDDAPSRVSILNRNGELLSRLEDKESIYDLELGSHCAHGLCVDSEGSLYIAEVGKKLKSNFYGVHKYVRLV